MYDIWGALMDILINNPIKISIDTIEIDEHLPSLELCISIDIEKVVAN